MLCDIILLEEFLGFWTLSIVRCLKEHDVSEIGSVSVLRYKGGKRTPTQLGPLERANLNSTQTSIQRTSTETGRYFWLTFNKKIVIQH
jgi:hypothetical protein